ncbi:nucleolus protein [Ophiostoma piceae UAMH 11346]|uniref:25S rRNA adenine-N(1) methyltransferase n=1 Tax=Ophiostoma piceae (strain UAMH 11346) TaxID=1262450 RepID=S3C5X1_OPHP1|nr:nucleolus protein [Ophiostoma piceae UAMH 11346]
MGTKKKNSSRPKSFKSLAAGRPPTVQMPPKSLSRRTTKRVINGHHQLEKRRLQAVARNDKTAEMAIAAEIEALGGIARYQQASLQGQRSDRGGDSSRVLMGWLEDLVAKAKSEAEAEGNATAEPMRKLKLKPKLRMLEVGALSTDNACSASSLFDMQRIDLNSQGPGILQQDFLQRPPPQSDNDRFDIISLSLVLNYVPQHSDRGVMLLRCLEFLHEPEHMSVPAGGAKKISEISDPAIGKHFPSVFLVLPEPCVANSRYLTEEKLATIMNSLGFDLIESKTSQRLVYYLWKRVRAAPSAIPSYAKKELRAGGTRNNFSIILQGT